MRDPVLFRSVVEIEFHCDDGSITRSAIVTTGHVLILRGHLQRKKIQQPYSFAKFRFERKNMTENFINLT